ncbi:MAG: hypothetical protein LWX01_11140 [Deltaproteobacteria bacterium]|nr:hypothetical protein [Deltaproteobacteria bacterium]
MSWTPLSRHKFTRNKVESFPVLPIYYPSPFLVREPGGHPIRVMFDKEGLEINGVNGSIEDWREILLPLLRIEKKGTELVAK